MSLLQDIMRVQSKPVVPTFVLKITKIISEAPTNQQKIDILVNHAAHQYWDDYLQALVYHGMTTPDAAALLDAARKEWVQQDNGHHAYVRDCGYTVE